MARPDALQNRLGKLMVANLALVAAGGDVEFHVDILPVVLPNGFLKSHVRLFRPHNQPARNDAKMPAAHLNQSIRQGASQKSNVTLPSFSPGTFVVAQQASYRPAYRMSGRVGRGSVALNDSGGIPYGPPSPNY